MNGGLLVWHLHWYTISVGSHPPVGIPVSPSLQFVPAEQAAHAFLNLYVLVPIFCVCVVFPVFSGPPNTRIKANTAPSAIKAKIIKPMLFWFMQSYCRPILALRQVVRFLLGMGSRTMRIRVLVMLCKAHCPFLLFLAVR